MIIAAPASAATDFSIAVTPAAGGHATETLSVTGDATEPVCAEDGVAVTLRYELPSGSTDTVTVNTTTDAAGHFSAELVIPENAVAGAGAFVQAVVADCDSYGARVSVSVPIDVQAYTGQFVLDRATGEPGQVVHVAGTNCWGNEVVVIFGNLEELVIRLDADRTFSGSYVLPHVKAGTYTFAASCPGSDFAPRSLRLLRPRVVSTTPVARATGVSVTANVAATFSTRMRPGSINRITFKLFRKGSTRRLPVSVNYNATTRRARLNPHNALEPGVTYKAVITSGTQGASGDFLDQNRSIAGMQPKIWVFTTRK